MLKLKNPHSLLLFSRSSAVAVCTSARVCVCWIFMFLLHFIVVTTTALTYILSYCSVIKIKTVLYLKHNFYYLLKLFSTQTESVLHFQSSRDEHSHHNPPRHANHKQPRQRLHSCFYIFQYCAIAYLGAPAFLPEWDVNTSSNSSLYCSRSESSTVEKCGMTNASALDQCSSLTIVENSG